MPQERPSLMLLACCAPDATVCIERLSPEWQVTVFFYNPNIQPRAEYGRRLDEMRKVAHAMGVTLIEGPYDEDLWLAAVRGLEEEPERGRRCHVCFRLRLEATAKQAVSQGIGTFTTTLTVSPHKDARLICSLGQMAAAQFGVQFLAVDFKKKDGFKRSTELSRTFGLYRQNYCGCLFSLRHGKREEV
ncbi:MAG: epoxyqueuosine reductase QueH [Candidatus Oleimicrobiaceae bacterium]